MNTGKIPHELKENKTTNIPSEFIFFDTETDQEEIEEGIVEHTLKLGVAVYWRRRPSRDSDQEQWFTFTEPGQFWNWVNKKARSESKVWLVAHNISFDAQVVNAFKNMYELDYEIGRIILDNQCNIWEFKKDRSKIQFVDNLNYFKSSLQQLGQAVGLDKKEVDFDTVSDDKLKEYCKRDVEILLYTWRKMINFVKDNDLGTFRPTIGSQALTTFAHRFNDEKLYIHDKDNVTELERESYHGGRTECFYIGEVKNQPIYSLDVNSMYPYLMKTKEYPFNFFTHINDPDIKTLKRWLPDNALVAKVRLTADEEVFASMIDEKLCFPIGTFETTLTTRELKYALERDYIDEVYELALYEKRNVFEDYIDFFYEKRLEYKKEGNKPFEHLTKLMLNSLYGKWGQKNEVWETVDELDEWGAGIIREWNVEEEREVVVRYINGIVQEKVGEKEAFNSFVAISSHITADARLLLWNYIKEAGEGNVFYCDTDSLFVNQVGYDNLEDYIDPDKLGALDIEKKARYLDIRNLKDYQFGTQEKIKGVRDDADQLSENKYEQWNFEGIRGALANSRINTQVMKKVTKTLNRKYDKGEIDDKGWVSPFNLD